MAGGGRERQKMRIKKGVLRTKLTNLMILLVKHDSMQTCKQQVAAVAVCGRWVEKKVREKNYLLHYK